MIDFNNANFFKLTLTDDSDYLDKISPMLVKDETIYHTYRAMRDGVVFTDRRLIVINVQGLTGRKIDFTSLPYSKIQAYSVETAGHIDLDSELELWFSGLGRVKLEFNRNNDLSGICRLISEKVL